jgi:hypothetical protein
MVVQGALTPLFLALAPLLVNLSISLLFLPPSYTRFLFLAITSSFIFSSPFPYIAT